MGVELALIQGPELIAYDLVCTLLWAKSHGCEQVVEDSRKLLGDHARDQGQQLRPDLPAF